MRHKHADLIHAWAEGAEIQRWNEILDEWVEMGCPFFSTECKYRIKPEKKPDLIRLFFFDKYRGGVIEECKNYNGCHDKHELKLTFCGETGKLKSAEVLNENS